MTDREALQRITERITEKVCSVHGVVTRAENNERARLLKLVGEDWDAINRRWVPLA